MRTVALVLLGLLWAGVAEAATYYTDKAGSDSNSCATAATASSIRSRAKLTIIAGKNCLTTPGDTLLVGNGTYIEEYIRIDVSGTQGNPITIRAENQLLAILSSMSGTTCSENIGIRASYVVIDGLRGQINAADPFCTPNSATGAFVRMWQSTVPSIGGTQSTGYQGSVVRNCQVDAHPNRSVGIKSVQDNTIVENCIMHSSLEALNNNNNIFRGNYIDTPDVWGDFFTSKGGARNTQFYNNELHAGSGVGRALVIGGNTSLPFFFDNSSGIECYNCVAYNNVIVMGGGNTADALVVTACKDCLVGNNVIIGGSLDFTQGSNLSQQGHIAIYPINPTVQNNIFYCNGVSTQSTAGKFTGTFTEDYNNFFNCTGTPSQAHPIIGDPRFVNAASDWHLLAGSPAIKTGRVITATGYSGENIPVNLTADGATRVTPWDLGIYAQNNSSTGSSDTTPPAAPQYLVIR